MSWGLLCGGSYVDCFRPRLQVKRPLTAKGSEGRYFPLALVIGLCRERSGAVWLGIAVRTPCAWGVVGFVDVPHALLGNLVVVASTLLATGRRKNVRLVS